MNRLIQYPIFALCICLLLWGCDPGSAGQGSSGSHVTDTVKTPGPGDSRGSRPWAADQNLLDPNALDGIADPLDEFLLPFSPDFLKARKLSGMEVRSYADSDNESLAENASEAELQISRKRVFAFNGAGQFSDLLEERFLGDATPVTSVHMAWTYLPAGLLSRIDFEEKVGSRKTQHQRRLSYDPSNKLTVVEDAASLTTYYMYDAALGQTYLTRRDAAGTCEVFVIGKKGDFSESQRTVIHEAILDQESKFVAFDKVGNKTSAIVFLEREGRKTVREVHMSRKEGQIDHTIDRQYNADGNITERKYQWDVPNADFKTLTKYRYSPTGDLIEVFHQKQSFNQPIVNEIDRYTYDADGLLQKRIRSTRKGQEADELLLVEYYSTSKAQPAAPTSTGQPTGTQ